MINGKRKYICLLLVWLAGAVCNVNAADVMRKTPDGAYVVNTATLCDARGFRAGTPVEVTIKDGKVVKVETLPNNESPDYFAKIKKYLLPQYVGLKIGKAKKLSEKNDVDGCTGATYSTKAVQRNVRAALDYYEKHK